MKILLVLFTVLVTFNSCDSSKKAVETLNDMQQELTGTYAIHQIGNNDSFSKAITMSFDESSLKVTGFAGCNSYFGSYALENNTIKFGQISSSKKFCRTDVMQLENHFIKALNMVNSFVIEDGNISFYDKDNLLIKGSQMKEASGKSPVVNYEDNTAVKYQSLSRNSFDYIIVSKSGVLVSKDRNLKDIDRYPISTDEWEAVNELIDAVDKESLRELEPPSKKHQYDGAPHAVLAIITGDVEYMSQTFDHGNPPQRIEALVNKVLSIMENIEKQ